MPAESRHKIVLFGLSKIRCRCGWNYDQSVKAGLLDWKLQDALLDAYNIHVASMSQGGRP